MAMESKNAFSEPETMSDEKKTMNRENESSVFRLILQRRYLVVSLCCLGMVLIHSMRVNISITAVTILDDEATSRVSESNSKRLPKVKWNPTMIGFLQSVFYLGFLISQAPAGYMVTKLPSHRIFGIAILSSSTLNLLLPTAFEDVGYFFACSIRFLQGLSEGCIFPSVSVIIREWSNKKTVPKYGGIIFSGMYAGAIIGFPLDGVITHYFHWQIVYYIHGIMGIIWFSIWFCSIYEKPEYDPHITKEELQLIKDSGNDDANHQQKRKVPWRYILSSPPVWAIVVCHFVGSWTFVWLLTNEPAYLNQFKFSLAMNGIYASLPPIFMVLSAFSSSILADYLINSQQYNKTHVRKALTCIAFGVESICFFALIGVSEGHVAVVILCIGVGLSGFAVSGSQINHLDLAPQFTSILVGISGTIGTTGGIIGPIVIGIMTHPQTMQNWQRSFAVTGSILLIGVIFYLIFGSGERQRWASDEEFEPIVGVNNEEKDKLTN